MSRKIPPQHAVAIRPFILAGIIITTFVALGWALSARSLPPPQQAAAPHFVDATQAGNHQVNPAIRTVVIARMGEQVPGISGETGPLMTNLVRGTYPEGATVATVRTDENCAPDQNGVSHCLNELDFGQTKVVVQHHHAMDRTPCLTPGETVQVMTVVEFNS